MIQRSHEEMVATARVAGAELDDRYVKLAADAMAVWWDEVVAVREESGIWNLKSENVLFYA